MAGNVDDSDSAMHSTPEQADTPPLPTRTTQPSFSSQPSPANSSMQMQPQQHTQQPATPHQATKAAFTHTHGMETPPPVSAVMHFNHHHNTALFTPGGPTGTGTGTGTGTPLRSQGQSGLVGEGIPPPPPHCKNHPEHKSAAEAWAAAGWGGKRALEEYEIQRDRLLDSGLKLAVFGDDYDETDMWK